MQVEARLLEASRFTQQIVESATVGIVVYDRQFRYLLWNPFLEQASGLSAREVLGKNALELFPLLREFGIDRLLDRALAGETVTAPEVRYNISRSGKSGWYSATYSPF